MEIVGRMCNLKGFKNQVKLQPLLASPEVNKVYKRISLWPFIEARTLSIKRPKVQKYFEKHPLGIGNLVLPL